MNSILEKYDLLYTLVSLNENEATDKLNAKIKNLIAKTLEKLEQQKRYQDAKVFAQRVKKELQSNKRLKAILYCILIMIVTIGVFGKGESQNLMNGEYSNGEETVECIIDNNGNINIEEVKDDIQKEQKIKNKRAADFKISNEGKEFIKDREKLRLDVYYATKAEKTMKILTVGYGHRIKKDDAEWLKSLKEGDTITQKQAEELFNKDIAYFENEAERLIKKNSRLQSASIFPQGFIDGFVSILFNSGSRNMQNTMFFSKLMNCKLNADKTAIDEKDYNYTISFIPKTLVKQKGKVVNGLVIRRADEFQMMKIQ